MPTYHRPKPLQNTLQAIIHLDYPDHEIIVVDDGSPQPARVPDGVTLVRQANAGPAAARNAGAAIATGDLLAFTDDDCCPASNWLSELVMQHRQTPDALLGGRTVNGLPRNRYATATQLMTDFLRDDPPVFFPSNNWGIGRSRFHQLGGLNTNFPIAAAEDRDFCSRAQPLIYCPTAIVTHHHDLTWRTFWQQHVNYGRGARQLRTVQDTTNLSRWSFYLRLIGYPIQQHGLRGIPSSILLMVAQLATAAGYFNKSLRTQH